MKILIIEDDKFISTVYESEFHQQNIEVELAFDGIAGLAKARECKPDLILLDLILPKLNGFEVLREIKADPEISKIPVIVSSSLNQSSDIDEVINLGATKFFAKETSSPKQVVKEIIDIILMTKSK